MPTPTNVPPVPPVPNPDPKATIAAAMIELKNCYPEDQDIADLVAAGLNASCLSLGDVLGLYALAAAKAACNAKNPDPSCCEADPFQVANLIVDGDSETDTLTVTGDATFNNLNIGGSLCVSGIPSGHLTGTDLIIAQDTGGCFKSFPRSDLDPFNLHLPGTLEVDGSTDLHGTLHVTSNAQFDGDVAVGGNLFVGGQICVGALDESEFTSDCNVIIWKAGCLYKMPIGTCCSDSPPPDPDPPTPPTPPPAITCPLRSIPPIPSEFIPVGANATRELEVFLDTNPTPPGGWKQLVDASNGPSPISGYAENTKFSLFGTSGVAPTFLGNIWYNVLTGNYRTTPQAGSQIFGLKIYFFTTGVVVFFYGFDSDYQPSHTWAFQMPAFENDVYSGSEC